MIIGQASLATGISYDKRESGEDKDNAPANCQDIPMYLCLRGICTPQQLATFLALHQQAANQLGGDHHGGAGEEGLRECWEGLGGYGSGC